jgi:hypothetical protein
MGKKNRVWTDGTRFFIKASDGQVSGKVIFLWNKLCQINEGHDMVERTSSIQEYGHG